MMNQYARKRMEYIDLLSKGDSRYHALLKEFRILEQRYDAVLASLPDIQRDTMCDFFSLCEEMSFRKLEIACTYMIFPE